MGGMCTRCGPSDMVKVTFGPGKDDIIMAGNVTFNDIEGAATSQRKSGSMAIAVGTGNLDDLRFKIVNPRHQIHQYAIETPRYYQSISGVSYIENPGRKIAMFEVHIRFM